MAQATKIKPWLTEGEEKREAVRDMFAEIAPTYDLANSIMSARRHYKWRQKAVAQINLQAGESVLDLCCGTGDFLLAARERVGVSGQLVGLDFCRPMLDVAAKKIDGSTQLALGDATVLPFASSSFNAVTVGWGLRNVPDLKAALAESFRVLKLGGRFITVDMAEPEGWHGPISRKVYHVIIPILGRILGKAEAYAYLPKSTEKFVSRQSLKDALLATGYTDIEMKNFCFGNICMMWGVKK